MAPGPRDEKPRRSSAPMSTSKNWISLKKDDLRAELKSRSIEYNDSKPQTVARLSAILTLWDHGLFSSGSDIDEDVVTKVEDWWKLNKPRLQAKAAEMGVDQSGTIATIVGNMTLSLKRCRAEGMMAPEGPTSMSSATGARMAGFDGPYSPAAPIRDRERGLLSLFATSPVVQGPHRPFSRTEHTLNASEAVHKTQQERDTAETGRTALQDPDPRSLRGSQRDCDMASAAPEQWPKTAVGGPQRMTSRESLLSEVGDIQKRLEDLGSQRRAATQATEGALEELKKARRVWQETMLSLERAEAEFEERLAAQELLRVDYDRLVRENESALRAITTEIIGCFDTLRDQDL